MSEKIVTNSFINLETRHFYNKKDTKNKKILELNYFTNKNINKENSNKNTIKIINNNHQEYNKRKFFNYRFSNLFSSSIKMTDKKHKFSQNKITTTTILIIMILAIFSLLSSIISVECLFKRIQYHEQGLHGPKSYKFGYTSGDYKNPQERHEVSDGHGHVKGYYSYVDANGKHQVVHYEAHPKYGFKVYNYKSKAYNNGKRHYNS